MEGAGWVLSIMLPEFGLKSWRCANYFGGDPAPVGDFQEVTGMYSPNRPLLQVALPRSSSNKAATRTLSPPRYLLLMSRRYSLLLLLCAAPVWAAEDPVAQFEREVRPILEERCVECHGPDKQKGGLRLDLKTGYAGGDSEEAAVVPGKSADSQLIKRALSTDPEESMPPKGKRLDERQIAALRRWIDGGAHWPAGKEVATAEEAAAPGKTRTITAEDKAFWAFQKPRRMEPPGAVDEVWARQPLDRFISAGFGKARTRADPASLAAGPDPSADF